MSGTFGLVINSQPATEPITLAEAKLHLRVDITADDALITALIAASRLEGENQTRRAFITQTLELFLDSFPPGQCPIFVPRPELQSVTTIKYDDIDGVEQTWDASKYKVDTANKPGRIVPVQDESYPSTLSQINAVRIIYIAGYGVASAVPESIKAAMKLTIGHWYENREEVIATGRIPIEVPYAAKRLYMSERVFNEQ